MERRPALRGLLFLLLRLSWPIAAQPSIDGGRSDLPGMKQDIFDRIQSNKNKGPQPRSKAPPECPKSDGQSAFYSFAFVSGEVFVRPNSTDGPCVKLLSIGGANYSTLINASRTCGPAGEFKRRIAENMSSMFFQAGLDWPKNENETIEIETEEGTYEVLVNEEKYAVMLECWKRACGCEQANNPVGRAIFLSILVIMVGGVFFDSFKLMLEKKKGKKPPKNVECKKGHKLEEVPQDKVKFAYRYVCDVCGKQGTSYQCSVSCNYDLCAACYKTAKKKLKKEKADWLEKHPEEKDNKKKKKKDKDEDETGDSDAEKSEGKSEGKRSTKDGDSETETKAESEGTDADTKKEDKEETEGTEGKEEDEEDKKDEKEEQAR